MAMRMRMSIHVLCHVVLMILGLVVLVGRCHGQVPGGSDSDVEVVSFTDPRRVLAGTQYYISYGALNANRAPCPSGQGRSYYTNTCQPTSAAPQPYVRSCGQITRCARG